MTGCFSMLEKSTNGPVTPSSGKIEKGDEEEVFIWLDSFTRFDRSEVKAVKLIY